MARRGRPSWPVRFGAEAWSYVMTALEDGTRVPAKRRADLGDGGWFIFQCACGAQFKALHMTGEDRGWPALTEATDIARALLASKAAAARKASRTMAGTRRRAVLAAATTDPLDYQSRRLAMGRQHPGIETAASQVNDSEGGIGTPLRVVDTVQHLRRNGSISDNEERAARLFQDDFDLAQLDGLRAMPLVRVKVDTSFKPRLDPNEAAELGRHKLAAAMKALGGHGTSIGSAAWFVLGVGETLKEFATRQCFARSAADSQKAAACYLKGALSVLAVHYRLEDEILHLDNAHRTGAKG